MLLTHPLSFVETRFYCRDRQHVNGLYWEKGVRKWLHGYDLCMAAYISKATIKRKRPPVADTVPNRFAMARADIFEYRDEIYDILAQTFRYREKYFCPMPWFY